MLHILPLTQKKPCNPICRKAGSNVGGKTRSIAIHWLVLQQCTLRAESPSIFLDLSTKIEGDSARRVAAMLQNKLHVFVARFTVA